MPDWLSLEPDFIPYPIFDEEIEHDEIENRLYAKKYGEVVVQIAKLRLLGIGKWAFETSIFGEKPFETNMNMPLFNTQEEAYAWIERDGKWKREVTSDVQVSRSYQEF